MNLKALLAFKHVIENRSLAGASAKMNLSVPAVSRHITLLEAELGMALFSRDKRSLVPTEEGDALYLEADRLLQTISQLPEIVEEIKNSRSRLHRVASIPKLANTVAVKAVTQFNGEYPEARVSLELFERKLMERWVAGGQFAFGLGTVPAHHPGIRSERLGSFPLVAIFPRNHHLSTKDSITIHDLADDPFVALRKGSSIRGKVDEMAVSAGVKLNIRSTVVNAELVCGLVARGAGVSICDDLVASAFGDRLHRRTLIHGGSEDYGLLFNRDRAIKGEVTRLVEAFRTVFEAMRQE